MVLATGQITIIDYNDALSLTAYITSSTTKSQMYNPDNGSYTPDWKSENVTLRPSLFKLGTSDNIINSASVTSVKWYDVSQGSEKLISGADYAISGKNLVIKNNVMAGLTGKDFMCEITYHDDSTNLDLTVKTDITFTRVVNGSGIADAIAWLPDGNVFKNETPSLLKVQCDFWRGSVVDTTDVTYQWYQKDNKQATDVGGGTGWRKLANASSKYAGVTTSTLTVYAESVLNYDVFKCVVKDTDKTSNSYNKEFVDTATLIDQSDPVQCEIVSTGGTVFKNGSGSSTLTARLYRAGEEIDSDGTKYTYKWYKRNNGGSLVTGWGGSGINYKTGKSLTIGGNDVDTKATFSVEVE